MAMVSPAWAARTSPTGSSVTEEVSHQGGYRVGAVEGEGVAAAVEDVDPRVRHQLGEPGRLGDREHGVLGAPDDQCGLAGPGQRGLSDPPVEAPFQLVGCAHVVRPGGRAPYRVDHLIVNDDPCGRTCRGLPPRWPPGWRRPAWPAAHR